MIPKEYTAQQVFDETIKHLRKQGPARMGGTCYYRLQVAAGSIKKCAAGLWISDSEYEPEMEGKTICGSIFNSIDFGPHYQLLVDLQTFHDNCLTNETGAFDENAFNRRALSIASEYGLSIDVLA